MAAETYPKVYLYRRIVQAKLFIDQHYAGAVDLSNMADEAFFSRFHFIRLFKKAYDKTPHQYLTCIRIERAKQLLQSGTTVADVCDAVGYGSISSFTGLFKRAVGTTPAAYQQQQLTKKAALAAAPLTFIPHCFAQKKGWVEKSNFEEV